MKAFLTFVCCFFTVAFSLPAQTLLEGYVRDMECRGISEAVVTVMHPDTREVIYSTQTDTAGVFVLTDCAGRRFVQGEPATRHLGIHLVGRSDCYRQWETPDGAQRE